MSKKAKVLVATAVAALSLGALAPAASARNYLGRDVDRILNRDVARVMDRDVPNLTDGVADVIRDTAQNTSHGLQDAGRWTARTLQDVVNPR